MASGGERPAISLQGEGGGVRLSIPALNVVPLSVSVSVSAVCVVPLPAAREVERSLGHVHVLPNITSMSVETERAEFRLQHRESAHLV